MPLPSVIPWYSVYTKAVGALWLAGIILCHAAAVAAAARDRAAAARAEDPPELLRFTPVDDDDDDGDDDADSVLSGESVDNAAPFVEHLRLLARRVFGYPALRRRQEVAVTRLLFGEGKGKLLLVERTGGGKSLVLALTAAFVGGVVSGVVVVIVLLPALTAEQLARINRAVQWPGVDGLMPWIEHTHWPSRARSSRRQSLWAGSARTRMSRTCSFPSRLAAMRAAAMRAASMRDVAARTTKERGDSKDRERGRARQSNRYRRHGGQQFVFCDGGGEADRPLSMVNYVPGLILDC